MTDQKILDLIKGGKHSRALSRLYKIYPAVRKYVIQSGGNQSDTEDIFQDALVIFIEKASLPGFNLSSSISTFLFGICKNLCRERRRQASKEVLAEPNEIKDEHTKNIEDFLEEERKYNSLDKILIETGQKCLELLKMFYLDKIPMKAIAQRMGFKSETSAKTQKYKCIEKARNLTGSVLYDTLTS